MTRPSDPKPSGLVFTEVRRTEVVPGDLYANGGTVTESREPTEAESSWARKYDVGQPLWFIECGSSFSQCASANGYTVVGRRTEGTS